MSVEIKSLIIFFTLPKGSAATCIEICCNTRLFNTLARSARKAATRLWISPMAVLLSCARAVPCCARAGRCSSPAPETASLDMMSIAWEIASISSLRSFWRALKSSVLRVHSAVVSSRYFWSSARSDSACPFSPSLSALACCVSERSTVFFSTSCFAFSVLSVSCCAMSSKACWAVISSLSKSYFCVSNWSFNFSSMSTTPPDWNS
mmetsp:Transcript_37575/g.106600  ORF Transcript_37575/g.106600 Transcript_37575/m.106600 type:complete len:206 (+) Transcript_37575:404-1021(+)